MCQTRFIFGLEDLMAFASVVGKEINRVGEQTVNLLFAGLLHGKQRFEGFQRWQQPFKQFAMAGCAGL
ncbi:hypothetical protein D3C72_1019260 [compost metagenome]